MSENSVVEDVGDVVGPVDAPRFVARGELMLVLPDRPEKRSGRIHLSEDAQRPKRTGIVVCVGPDVESKMGLDPVGLRVFWLTNYLEPYEVDGCEYHVMCPDDVGGFIPGDRVEVRQWQER